MILTASSHFPQILNAVTKMGIDTGNVHSHEQCRREAITAKAPWELCKTSAALQEASRESATPQPE